MTLCGYSGQEKELLPSAGPSIPAIAKGWWWCFPTARNCDPTSPIVNSTPISYKSRLRLCLPLRPRITETRSKKQDIHGWWYRCMSSIPIHHKRCPRATGIVIESSTTIHTHTYLRTYYTHTHMCRDIDIGHPFNTSILIMCPAFVDLPTVKLRSFLLCPPWTCTHTHTYTGQPQLEKVNPPFQPTHAFFLPCQPLKPATWSLRGRFLSLSLSALHFRPPCFPPCSQRQVGRERGRQIRHVEKMWNLERLPSPVQSSPARKGNLPHQLSDLVLLRWLL
jgi:hypothetical protein